MSHPALSAFTELGVERSWDDELLSSLRSGNAEAVRRSLESGANVNATCRDSILSTPLHVAAAQSSPACLIELLRGTTRPVCERNADGESPLFIACRTSHSIAIPLLLLSTYGLPAFTNERHDTFLHVLVANESLSSPHLLELVQWILSETDAALLLNKRNARDKTVYDVARAHRLDDHALLRLLIEHGATSACVQQSGRLHNARQGEAEARAIVERDERQARQALCAHCVNSEMLLQSLVQNRARLQSSENLKRSSLAAKESDRRAHVARKFAKETEAHLRRARRRRKAAVMIVQAVGRGYVCRHAIGCEQRRARDHTIPCEEHTDTQSGSVAVLQRVGRGALSRGDLRRLSILSAPPPVPEPVPVSPPAAALPPLLVSAPTMGTDSDVAEHVVATPERRRTKAYLSESNALLMPHSGTAEGTEDGFHPTSHSPPSLERLVGGDCAVQGRSPPSSTVITVRFTDPSPAADGETTACTPVAPSVSSPSSATAVPTALKTLPLPYLMASESAENTPELLPLAERASALWSEADAAYRIQVWWRRWHHRRRAAAVTVIANALSVSALRVQLLNYRLEKGIKWRIQAITTRVTALVWRENFCSEFRRITREKRFARRAATATSPTRDPSVARPWYRRWGEVTQRYQQWTLLLQMAICLFLLIYMGCASRAGANNVHNKVDITFCAVQLALLLAFPSSWWRVVDGAVIITALVCAACQAYGGTVVITLLLLKTPLLVSYCVPNHSATATFCRALRYCGLYLLMLSPVGLACVGSTVRGTSVSALMLTSGGNWARILLVLWSTLSPQYVARTLTRQGDSLNATLGTTVPLVAPFYGAQTVTTTTVVNDEWVLVTSRLPSVQLLICNVGLLIFFYCSMMVGTSNAIREHYDLSDETKLMRNKQRFQYKHYKQKMELLDAHRAATIEALGQQLDGLMWEDDVRAAKEAIRESHKTQFQAATTGASSAVVADVNTPSRKADAVTQAAATQQPSNRVTTSGWDCRNEDPQSRGRLDIAAIETALGKAERTGRRERFFIRQWKGSIFRRESTLVVVAFVIMSAVEPNLYAMEIVFSTVYAVELLLSFYFVRVEFILSHPWRLLIRLFCVVIGFVPSGIPFVVLRGLRLLEGWSALFDIPGMVKWGFMYCIITLVTIWMVSFVASLQFAQAAQSSNQPESAYCRGVSNCLALSLRELVMPAWTPLRIDPVREPPLMCLLIIGFQFLFIPFMLSFMLHPLLQLSNFIGRFLRLVVRSLHKDVLGFLANYIEGEEWFRRWALAVAIPTNVIVKLKLWVHDIQRPPIGFSPFAARISTALAHERSFFFRNDTMVMPLSSDDSEDRRDEEGVAGEPAEIVSKSRFASLSETANQQHLERRLNGVPIALQQRQRKASLAGTVVATPSQMWAMKIKEFSRQVWLHVLNALLTAVSFAFLWAADASCGPRDVLSVVATIFHMASIVTNILVVPRDLTAILTVISSASLILSVVMIHAGSARLRPVYAARFLSLLRLAQIQVYPFRAVRSFLKEYLASWLKILFPFLLVGGLSFAAELLRAQIYMVRHPTFAGVNMTKNFAALKVSGVGSNWPTAPPFALAANGDNSDPGYVGNVSYPEWLASLPREHRSRPNVNATRSLFSFYFTEDAYIFFAIFNFWLLPALAISTCLSYLYWSGSNLRDTDYSVISLIPFLEDPLTLASFRFSQSYFHYFTNAILVLSVTFGCIFSPSTGAVATKDHNFFFAFEVGFTVVGLIDALFSVAFAVYRSRRTWAGRSISRQDYRYVHILVGDTALVLAEVVQLLYYCVALPIAIAMLVDADQLLLSADGYALYFITLRFALLLRLLPRQSLLMVTQAFPNVVFACAGIVIYYIASASALADTAGAASSGLTTRLWRAAFSDLVRESLTLAVPTTFTSQWAVTNESKIAQQMLAAGTYTIIDTDHHAASIMVFILSTIGKGIVASAVGLSAALLLVPVRTPLVASLPPKSAQLYRALSGGINAIVKEGEALHDDMRPDARRRLQRRKFTRLFTARGIPSWGLRHLLEELNIARPSRQRRFVFLLEQLLIYLPISELRQEQVREYMNMWSCYCSGGPATLSFSELAAYPPRVVSPQRTGNPKAAQSDSQSKHPANPLDAVDTRSPRAVSSEWPLSEARHIAPLRLIQALALFELNFPVDSSIGSQLLMDFFTVVQKVRGATLMQSLWRMYQSEKRFETDPSRSKLEKVKLMYLRRRFRKLRMKNDATFRRSAAATGDVRRDSFAMALARDAEVYNLDTGHYDLLNRIRGHYQQLTLDVDYSTDDDDVQSVY